MPLQLTPPAEFDLGTFMSGVYTFQSWEIFPGHRTNGPKDVVAMLANLGVPADLSGKRVLDIAPWNGFFSFECVRRGAEEVVSLGPDDPDKTGYNRVRDVLDATNCRYIRGSVYDLTPELAGTFDVVLFLGVIYHLRHPLLALDRIYDIARNQLYVDSPIIDLAIFDKTISAEATAEILAQGACIHQLPMFYFTPGGETGDAYNWFMPNRKALHALVASSGFRITSSGDDGACWAWLAAIKDNRAFVPNLEGWNADAVNYDSNN